MQFSLDSPNLCLTLTYHNFFVKKTGLRGWWAYFTRKKALDILRGAVGLSSLVKKGWSAGWMGLKGGRLASLTKMDWFHKDYLWLSVAIQF